HSSNAAFAVATARPTSSEPEEGKVPSTSPVAGLVLSKVSVATEAKCTGWPLLRRVGLRERPRDPRPPPVARLALLDGLGLRPARSAVGPLATVDDHRHVRVVLVVVDHLLVELVRQLPRDHAVDHPATNSRTVCGER